MIPQERANLYAKAFPEFPDSHFMISDRWISSTWMTGNNYHNPSGYYGSYPPNYLSRIFSMYPDSKTILHLFSGSLKDEELNKQWAKVNYNNSDIMPAQYRFDRKPELEPDIVGEANDLSSLWNEQWAMSNNHKLDLILADPPYSVEDAEHYGSPLVNKKRVLEECHKILEPGGTLAWMDQSVPMFRKDMWNWYGIISMYRSTNHRIRGVMLFEKLEKT